MLLNKTDLISALAALEGNAKVYVPGVLGEISRFILWDGKSNVDISGDNTTLPPKDILFPQTEKMYMYRTGSDTQIKELSDDQKQVVFGIRPCDMASIQRMDQLFFEKDYRDGFYARKRENATFIALACADPCATCFCDSVGLDPNTAPGADVLLIDAGDSYGVTAQTDKGKEVLELWKGMLKKGETKPGKAACSLKANLREDLPAKLMDMFEHPIWDEVTKACIGCATCTYLCPTCYCFDINSENRGNEGISFRCWDSCMFSDYTLMAGGHNPRPTKKERLRNRYMHKLSYFKERHDTSLCVGCGRCIKKCPAHLDITEFIDKAAEVTV